MCLPGQSFQRQFGGEQLAYIAALALDAALVFGDRPKQVTYQRLMTLPSLSDLDRTFGAQVRSPSTFCKCPTRANGAGPHKTVPAVCGLHLRCCQTSTQPHCDSCLHAGRAELRREPERERAASRCSESRPHACAVHHADREGGGAVPVASQGCKQSRNRPGFQAAPGGRGHRRSTLGGHSTALAGW